MVTDNAVSGGYPIKHGSQTYISRRIESCEADIVLRGLAVLGLIKIKPALKSLKCAYKDGLSGGGGVE